MRRHNAYSIAMRRSLSNKSVRRPAYPPFRKAEGIWLEDYSGRRYMDFHGNSVHHIGYGHPRLVAALRQQMDEFALLSATLYLRVGRGLAEKLVAIAPGNLSKVLFAPSESDAIEIAMALARAATGRHNMLSFWDAYHGTGFGARSISGEAMFRSGKIGPCAVRHRACASIRRLSKCLGR